MPFIVRRNRGWIRTSPTTTRTSRITRESVKYPSNVRYTLFEPLSRGNLPPCCVQTVQDTYDRYQTEPVVTELVQAIVEKGRPLLSPFCN